MRANKVTILSLVVATALCANETTTLEQINVVEKSNSKLVKDISSEELIRYKKEIEFCWINFIIRFRKFKRRNYRKI